MYSYSGIRSIERTLRECFLLSLSICIKGSLSKDDSYGYGYENVIPKYNLALSQVFRDYSVLFTLYNTGELSCNWMGTNGCKVIIGNVWFIVICSLCRQNLKFGDLMLLCGVRQRNARKFVVHVQHEYLSFFDQSYSCFVSLS